MTLIRTIVACNGSCTVTTVPKHMMIEGFSEECVHLHQNIIFLFLNQNICCGYSKYRLNETVLLSTKTYVKTDG